MIHVVRLDQIPDPNKGFFTLPLCRVLQCFQSTVYRMKSFHSQELDTANFSEYVFLLLGGHHLLSFKWTSIQIEMFSNIFKIPSLFYGKPWLAKLFCIILCGLHSRAAYNQGRRTFFVSSPYWKVQMTLSLSLTAPFFDQTLILRRIVFSLTCTIRYGRDYDEQKAVIVVKQHCHRQNRHHSLSTMFVATPKACEVSRSGRSHSEIALRTLTPLLSHFNR